MSDLVTKAHFDAKIASLEAMITNTALRQTIALGGIVLAAAGFVLAVLKL